MTCCGCIIEKAGVEIMNKENPIRTWDRSSFHLGMINCFIEMVASGVKKLALSPPLTTEEYRAISKASDKIVDAFSIKSFLEKSLLTTNLQSEEFTSGKWNILYYEHNHILDTYFALKEKKRQLIDSGGYDSKAQKEISQEFMRLLSCSEEKITAILARKEPSSPYLLIDDPSEQG
jgi:hypothetical protein